MSAFQPDEIARLRDAFAVVARDAQPTEACPSPERLWTAARGELPRPDTRGLVDHTVSCAACAEAWRLAIELAREAKDLPAGLKPVGTRSWQRWAPLAAAAILIVAAAIATAVWSRRDQAATSEFRGSDERAIRSLTSEAEALPRSRCVLRWSPGPEGSLYTIEVASEDLTVLARADKLKAAEYAVPETALQSLQSGAKLLWQVRAVRPDGSRLTSPTFVTLVQ